MSFACPLCILNTSSFSISVLCKYFLPVCGLFFSLIRAENFDDDKLQFINFFLKCLEPISPSFFSVELCVYYGVSAMLKQVVYNFASVFIFCLCRTSKSTRNESLGCSHFSPGTINSLGHVHSPIRVCSLLDSLEYIGTLQNPQWTSQSQNFPFTFFD